MHIIHIIHLYIYIFIQLDFIIIDILPIYLRLGGGVGGGVGGGGVGRMGSGGKKESSRGHCEHLLF